MKKIITTSALTLLTLSLGLGVSAPQVLAATTTPTVSAAATDDVKIAQLRQLYSQLDQTAYTGDDMYADAPHFDYPFSEGRLKPAYIDATVDWVNYYRQLAGLSVIPATSALNKKSQVAAAAMAAAQVNPNLDQHGLNNARKPNYVSNATWDAARNTTAASNLFFHQGVDSPSYTIGSLIADNYNLDGQDTGHRAWMLSSRLSAFGIGAAVGANGWRYANQSIINPSDYDRNPSKAVVTYPGNGVFPIEELTIHADNAHPIPWSVYFSNDDHVPSKGITVSIKNNTTGAVGTGTNVQNFNQTYYGEYNGIVTFFPKNVTLTAGNSYTVTLKGLGSKYPNGYSYTFKLFKITDDTTTPPHTSNQQVDTYQYGTGTIQYVPGYSVAEWQTPGYSKTLATTKAKHGAVVTFTGRNYANGTYWYKLTNGNWIDGRYLASNAVTRKGVKRVNYAPGYGIAVWNSPYDGRKATGKTLKTGTAWKTFKEVTVNNQVWYNLGGNQWMSGQYLK